jgi:hypothetical protein
MAVDQPKVDQPKIVIDKDLAKPIYTDESLRKWRQEQQLNQSQGAPPMTEGQTGNSSDINPATAPL